MRHPRPRQRNENRQRHILSRMLDGARIGASRSDRMDGAGGVEIFGHLDGGNFLDAGRATVFAGD